MWLGDLGQSSYVMKERKKLVEHEITVQATHGVRGAARRFLGNAGVGLQIQRTAPGPPLVFPTVDQVDMLQLLSSKV